MPDALSILCDAQSDYLFQLPPNHVAHFRRCVLTEMGGGLGSQAESEPGVELFFAYAYFMAVELQQVVRATNVENQLISSIRQDRFVADLTPSLMSNYR